MKEIKKRREWIVLSFSPSPSLSIFADGCCRVVVVVLAVAIAGADVGWDWPFFDRRRNKSPANNNRYAVALYQCAPGYSLSAADTDRLYCRQGRWIGARPICIADYAGLLCVMWSLLSLSLSLSFFPILFFSLFPLLSLRSPYMFLNPFSLTILDLSWNIFSINFSLFEHVLYCFDFTRLLSLCFSLRLTHVSIQISFVPPLTLKNLFHELTKSSKCFPFFVAIMKITNFTPVICCYW